MQIGSFTVEVLSEGRFEIFNDGHINRSSPSDEDFDSQNEELSEPSSSMVVGINPILVKTGPYNVLLDAGLGWGLDAGSGYANVSNIQTNLEVFGLQAKDITHVILSHLHYDHTAGCSFTTPDFKTRATFPNAIYYVHEREWEYALTQVGKEQHSFGANYRLDDFYRLIADQNVDLLTGESNDIIDGITTICTGGHTPGHQAVIIQSSGKLAYYLGDLLPSSSHLNHYTMDQLDSNPIQAKKRKVQLLRSAFEKNACLFFYHSQHSQVGSLEKNDNKQYVLKEI
jgi:glyoxylase-like metal-dependent hydrolase (beta-lactamase superfamily II)